MKRFLTLSLPNLYARFAEYLSAKYTMGATDDASHDSPEAACALEEHTLVNQRWRQNRVNHSKEIPVNDKIQDLDTLFSNDNLAEHGSANELPQIMKALSGHDASVRIVDRIRQVVVFEGTVDEVRESINKQVLMQSDFGSSLSAPTQQIAPE